eukprot:5759073-Amphidinium_carterae.1
MHVKLPLRDTTHVFVTDQLDLPTENAGIDEARCSDVKMKPQRPEYLGELVATMCEELRF